MFIRTCYLNWYVNRSILSIGHIYASTDDNKNQRMLDRRPNSHGESFCGPVILMIPYNVLIANARTLSYDETIECHPHANLINIAMCVHFVA